MHTLSWLLSRPSFYLQGLPVLTMEGGTFPNRVVSSLYTAFDDDIRENSSPCVEESASIPLPDRPSYLCRSMPFQFRDWLVVSSKRSFEDTALQLVSYSREKHVRSTAFPHREERRKISSRIGFLKHMLKDAVTNVTGPFNADRNVFRFFHGLAALVDAHWNRLGKSKHEQPALMNWTEPLLLAMDDAPPARKLPHIAVVEPRYKI
jgi:hypothetical protein